MRLDYPLRFAPLFRRYLWGGRRLESVLGKTIGDGTDYAESWELVDHGADQSIVAAGPLAGEPLHVVVEKFNADLFGGSPPSPSFPLLFKFLDANKPLSVQVHPDDAYGLRMPRPDLGKTEAWIVLHAEPGSRLYAGLKRGFNRDALAREVARGTTELCLHQIEPRTGDCVFIPAGVPHALGAGLVIAEIQQASDTTFRLFDWNRVGPDGQPRALHIDQALEVIDYNYGPVEPQHPQAIKPHIERLVACDKFVLDRVTLRADKTIGGDARFHILAVLSGEVELEDDPAERPLSRGETALVPAACGALTVRPIQPTVLLDMYLPL